MSEVKLKGPWTCFHCQDSFHSPAEARQHFGIDEFSQVPACLIKGSEGGLLRALREAEEEALQARADLQAESADGLKAWRSAQSRNHAAVMSAEETGYERGLRDARGEQDALLGLLKRWQALDGGKWNYERHLADKAELLAETRAKIKEITGEEPQ